MNGRIGISLLAAGIAALGVWGLQSSPPAQQAPSVTLYALANVNGTLMYIIPPTVSVNPTVQPSATLTRTPSPTPSRTPTQVTPALPTVTNTPFEVTPLAPTPTFPHQSKADIEYEVHPDWTSLTVRRNPFKANNATGEKVYPGIWYQIWIIYEYADGSAWACLDDVSNWEACGRWFAIKADLSPVDGVLETYAVPEPEN